MKIGTQYKVITPKQEELVITPVSEMQIAWLQEAEALGYRFIDNDDPFAAHFDEKKVSPRVHHTDNTCTACEA